MTTLLRDAVSGDFEYIDSLRKREGDALGFIPRAAYESVIERRAIANRCRWLYSRILVTVDNGDLTGFCYCSFDADFAKIFQIVVQEDARRYARALLMTEEIERDAIQRGRFGITCRVAYDLESNFFWRAMGYQPVNRVTSTWLNQKESNSKRPLIVYQKVLMQSLFALPQMVMGVVRA